MCTVRRYLPEDRERLRFICKETAWDSCKKDKKKPETVPILYNDHFICIMAFTRFDPSRRASYYYQ